MLLLGIKCVPGKHPSPWSLQVCFNLGHPQSALASSDTQTTALSSDPAMRRCLVTQGCLGT